MEKISLSAARMSGTTGPSRLADIVRGGAAAGRPASSCSLSCRVRLMRPRRCMTTAGRVRSLPGSPPRPAVLILPRPTAYGPSRGLWDPPHGQPSSSLRGRPCTIPPRGQPSLFRRGQSRTFFPYGRPRTIPPPPSAPCSTAGRVRSWPAILVPPRPSSRRRPTAPGRGRGTPASCRTGSGRGMLEPAMTWQRVISRRAVRQTANQRHHSPL